MEQKVIKPFKGVQEDFLKCSSDIVVAGGAAGSGKLGDIRIPVPTPDGWKKLGDIVAGDRVFDEDGKVCTVTEAFPIVYDEPCYEIDFGFEKFIVGGSHLWHVYSYRERAYIHRATPEYREWKRKYREKWNRDRNIVPTKWKLVERNKTRKYTYKEYKGEVLTTLEMKESLKTPDKKQATNWATKVNGAVDYSYKELPIDPYLLGLWLGDGTAITGEITKSVEDLEEIAECLKEKGYSVKILHGKSLTKGRLRIENLTTKLKEVGLYGNKHVPEIYLRASYNQRLELVQGLMDTDGTVDKGYGGLEFDNTNVSIAEGMYELLHSLGIKTSALTIKEAYCYGRRCKDCYRISWVSTIPMFKLNRKLQHQKNDKIHGAQKWNYVYDIKPLDFIVPMRCIATDSPSHTFLWGRSFIPTHNSFSLLLDPLRYVNNPAFAAVIFRRSTKDITNAGALFDKAMELYLPLGATVNKQQLTFTFPAYEKQRNGRTKIVPQGGGKIQLSHLYEENNKYDWQGAELCYIGFDELTHFTYTQFEYLMSRNRNTAGIPNLIRATCNPDPDSFLRKMLDPYIDEETGFPKKEMAGKQLWLVIEDGQFMFFNSEEEALKDNPERLPKTFTFLPATIKNNPYLANDKSYLASLNALNEFERRQLLEGCWLHRNNEAQIFRKEWFDIVDINRVPNIKRKVRGWDLAASRDKDTAKKQRFDYSASVKLEEGTDGYIYITDMTNEQLEPFELNERIKGLAESDGIQTVVRLPQDPGSAGKHLVYEFSMKLLRGFVVHYRTMRSDKVSRAQVVSDKASKGLFKVLRGKWNDEFFRHLERFPPLTGSPNIVDAFVEAFVELNEAENSVSVAPIYTEE